MSGVKDGAGVVIENRTGAVRALVGTLDFLDPVDGQVNAAAARRSPGSALKPFLYLAALERGIVVADTRPQDRPLEYIDYRPHNFDHLYRRTVRLGEALSSSLNTPAVRLLAQVGTAGHSWHRFPQGRHTITCVADNGEHAAVSLLVG